MDTRNPADSYLKKPGYEGKKQRKQLNAYITEKMFLKASILGRLNAEMVLSKGKERKHQETK